MDAVDQSQWKRDALSRPYPLLRADFLPRFILFITSDADSKRRQQHLLTRNSITSVFRVRGHQELFYIDVLPILMLQHGMTVNLKRWPEFRDMLNDVIYGSKHFCEVDFDAFEGNDNKPATSQVEQANVDAWVWAEEQAYYADLGKADLVKLLLDRDKEINRLQVDKKTQKYAKMNYNIERTHF